MEWIELILSIVIKGYDYKFNNSIKNCWFVEIMLSWNDNKI